MREPGRPILSTTLLHYRILSKLGEGGMGSVYEAEDTKLGRKVAIKTVLADASADAQPHRRLLNEARAASVLSHPNIVTIFAVEESSGVDFIVMELVGGEPLDAVLARGPLPISRVLAIGADVADALECAHESGIVHRDVKPANVLLTPRGRAKVCDFGLAKPTVHTQGRAHDPTLPITADGVVVGTLVYMSPEQLSGETLDARSDVFALGCLLYEAATGRRAFPQDDMLSVIRAIAVEEPAAPSSIVAGIPARFDALMRWALAKDRNQRAPSAAAIALELRALASGSQELPRSLAGRVDSTSARRGSPFSGRADEMASLTRLLEDAIGGRGSLVAIAGAAGAGKTRLTQEIAARAKLRGVRTLVGRCSSDEGAPPYVAFLDALGDAVAQAGAAQMRAKLDSSATMRLATMFPSLGEAPVSPAQATSSAAERYALFQAVTSVVRELGADNGLLLILEDVHWACLPTLRLLHHLGRNIASMRVLLLATYRDDEVAGDHPLSTTLGELRREGVSQPLVLRPLGSGEVRAMARAACGVDPSEGFVCALLARTEGNPLFVEEMLSHLAENGRIQKASEATGDKEAAALLGVPEGVRALIGHRLSRLDEKCRQALARASVIGATFRWDLLLAAADAGEDALLDAMDEALRARLVREVKGGAPAYEFTHALVRETLYDGLGAARRARLHRRIGEALERAVGGADAQAAELALHFFHASASGGDDARKAASYGKSAAEQAMAKLAYEQAADACARALDRARLVPASIADVRGLERDLYRLRGLALACIGNWKAARADLESALERLDDDSARAQVLLQLCRVAFFCLDSAAVGRHAELAEAAAAAVGDSQLQAEAIGWRMAAVIIDGDLERGGQHYERGRAMGGSRYVSSLGWRAIAHYWAGRFEDAIRVADESARGARSAGDVQTLMLVKPVQGMALASLGRYGDATHAFGEAAQLGRRYSVLSLTARSLAMSVGAQLEVFDYAGVDATAGEAIELAFSLRFTPTRFAATIDRIVAAAQRDDVATAERLLADAREMHEELRVWHDWIWSVRVLWAEAEVALAKSDWESARSLAAKMAAVEPARPKYIATAKLVTSICHERGGRRDEALADAREALLIARSMRAESLALRACAAILRVLPDESIAAEARRAHATLVASFGDARAAASFRSGAQRLFAEGALGA